MLLRSSLFFLKTIHTKEAKLTSHHTNLNFLNEDQYLVLIRGSLWAAIELAGGEDTNPVRHNIQQVQTATITGIYTACITVKKKIYFIPIY